MRNLTYLKRNSITGLISQILLMTIQFFTRIFFVKYLRIELLGVSSTFTSVLSTLSLAEMGIQTAIAYRLYKPLANKEEKQINDIINIFKAVYNSIGILFLIAGFAGLPLIKHILSEVTITSEIYCIFLLLALNSVVSYFMAYKRILLYADQREYLGKIVDLCCNLFFAVCKIIILIVTRSYLLYLMITIIHTFLSNYIINILCKRKYPFLHKDKLNKELFKVLFTDVKDLFWGKLCSYIYISTDNIIISKMFSTIIVGYMSNYTIITRNMASVVTSILNPLEPYIGKQLAIEDNKEKTEKSFLMYSYIRAFCALILVVPLVVLISDFVANVFGEGSVLDKRIMYLIAADLYISIAYASCYHYINGAGLFRYDKYVQLISSLMNIILSFAFARWCGILGVLFGTVVSQIVLWIGRSYLIYRYCFAAELRKYLFYWFKNLYYMLCTIMMIKLCGMIYQLLAFSNYFITFLIMGIICEIIVAVLFYLLTCHHIENKRIVLRLRSTRLSHDHI
jgi:O-antigen/teichoic acid export membrane protein